jgi:prepilin-type N-terminal cleavage/methylation domain-containing protein
MIDQKRNEMKKAQSGFTLVEIAIVLVIIGLLLGGVLKGQAMIESAKVKALANEMKAVQTAYYTYQDKFRAVPGDDALATTHLGATVQGVTILNPTGPANGLIDTGTWIGAATPVAGNESALFWMHTRAAGLMTGSAASGVATNSGGGALGITRTSAITTATMTGSQFVCSGGIDGTLAAQLDTVLDGGAPNTGSVQATAGAAITTAAAAATTYTAGTVYTVCMSF